MTIDHNQTPVGEEEARATETTAEQVSDAPEAAADATVETTEPTAAVEAAEPTPVSDVPVSEEPAPEPTAPAQPDEYFGRDLVSVMDTMIGEAINEVGKPAAQMTRDEKIAVLQRLDARGATQMRKSVETIAVRLGISRVTAYAYLDEARRAAN